MAIHLPLQRDDIQHYLPHRSPMLLVDRVVALTDQAITVEADIKADADYFKGHFPDMPIQPGVLIVESVAQSGALLVKLSDDIPEGQFLAFSSIESAKFKKPVFPGETLVLDVCIIRKRLPFYKFSGQVKSRDKIVASVDFSAVLMEFNRE